MRQIDTIGDLLRMLCAEHEDVFAPPEPESKDRRDAWVGERVSWTSEIEALARRFDEIPMSAGQQEKLAAMLDAGTNTRLSLTPSMFVASDECVHADGCECHGYDDCNHDDCVPDNECYHASDCSCHEDCLSVRDGAHLLDDCDHSECLVDLHDKDKFLINLRHELVAALTREVHSIVNDVLITEATPLVSIAERTSTLVDKLESAKQLTLTIYQDGPDAPTRKVKKLGGD